MTYTAQEPWIQNCSLRDHILMGLPFQQGRYASVLDTCALLPDLQILPAGDLTEIGLCCADLHELHMFCCSRF